MSQSKTSGSPCQTCHTLLGLADRNVAEPEAFCHTAGFARLPPAMQQECWEIVTEAKAIRHRIWARHRQCLLCVHPN